MGGITSKDKLPHKEGDELSATPPPPPGAAVMQDREFGALGVAKLRTTRRDTPEIIAAEKRLKGSCDGYCPPWGHTRYPVGNSLTFQGEEQGIEQLLKDPWPEAWLAIQPLLAQVDGLTEAAWLKKPGDYCLFPNDKVEYVGANYVQKRLVESAWLAKLNEVLNPHGLVADLYAISTYHILESTHNTNDDGSGGTTTYTGTTVVDLLLRIYLWSAHAAQAPPEQMQVMVPPGSGGGRSVAVVGPDGKQYNTIVPAGMMQGQVFMFQLPARPAMAPPTPSVQVGVPPGIAPGQQVSAAGPDGKQYSMAVPVGVGPGQSFQFHLPPDAAWWRSVGVSAPAPPAVPAPVAVPTPVAVPAPVAVPVAVPAPVQQVAPQGMEMERKG